VSGPNQRTSTTVDITHSAALSIDHVAVETPDLESSIKWYIDFFGGRLTWRLKTFSPQSTQRLPELAEVVEISCETVRFHLFTRASDYAPPTRTQPAVQFQHVCLSVSSPTFLCAWREKWFEVYNSGRYSYARVDPATEVDIDPDGNQSFYCHDINGLEFEFAYSPGGTG
jgi:catechol 2,3-dioxygenase-like lactoylglutathione lyase family enzyme